MDQASFDVFLGGWAASLEAAGLSVPELLNAMASAATHALDGRPLPDKTLHPRVWRPVRPPGWCWPQASRFDT